MFAGYFDSSYNGSPTGGSFVVAGWLATGAQWENFDSQWRSILSEFKVPHMHMKEFAHSVDAFEHGWKGDVEKRASFLQKLTQVTGNNIAASFSCLIKRSDCEVALQKCPTLLEHFGSEFALCSFICVQQVQKWLVDHGLPSPAAYVFEDGDVRGRLLDLMKSKGYPEPLYRSSKDIANALGIVRGLTPLQAADCLAYEMRKEYDDKGEDEHATYRKSFVSFANAASGRGCWAKLQPDDLVDMGARLACDRLPVV